MVITASVAAKPSDFQLEVDGSVPNPIGYAVTSTYTITYGWLGSSPTDIMVLQASWSLGSSNPSDITVVDYVPGSATLAMSQFSPQVDTANRTITWNIAPVPTGGNRIVSFKLKTRSLATGETPIPFTVSSRIIGPGITLPWRPLNQTYQAIIPTPTPTPTPSLTLTPTPTPQSSASATPIVTPGVTATPVVPPPTGGTVRPPRVPTIKEIPIIGPPVSDTIDTIDDIAKNPAPVAVVPAAAVATLPWIMTIVPALISLMPNLTMGQIFSLIGLLLWRQRRRPWGVVYDSRTKMPLDPVLLTLFGPDGKAHQTISDIYGRYQFVVEPGQYTLRAEKSNYSFPSIALANAAADEVYQDLYFGQPITVTETGVVSFNIPMDPVAQDWNQVAKQRAAYGWQTRLQKLSWYGFAAGALWSLTLAVLSPSVINLSIIGIYVLVMAAMLLYRVRHPAGVVYDRNHKPVAGAVVTLFDLQHPQMSRPPVVTTSSGRYAFLTDKGEYQLNVALKNEAGVMWPVTSTPPIEQKSKQGHIAKDITLP
jgi:hypothetical protein